jgi:hypothetical protein
METTYAPAAIENYSDLVEQEQSLENTFNKKLREMSKIILNHQNKIKSIKSVKYVLDTNSDIINTLPDFISARDVFIDRINILNDFYCGTKSNFIKITLQVAEALKEYGVMTENSEIIEQGKIRKEHLIKKTDKEIAILGITILNFIKPYFQSLCQIGNLNNILSIINESPGLPKEMVPDEEITLIDLYNNIYNEIKIFLCRTIDALVNEIKDKFPRFYIEYKTVRIAANIETIYDHTSPVWV